MNHWLTNLTRLYKDLFLPLSFLFFVVVSSTFFFLFLSLDCYYFRISSRSFCFPIPFIIYRKFSKFHSSGEKTTKIFSQREIFEKSTKSQLYAVSSSCRILIAGYSELSLSYLHLIVMDESYESVLFIARETYLYQIPPRTSAEGYRASAWGDMG